jgi:hypothetical protein
MTTRDGAVEGLASSNPTDCSVEGVTDGCNVVVAVDESVGAFERSVVGLRPRDGETETGDIVVKGGDVVDGEGVGVCVASDATVRIVGIGVAG